MKNFKFFILLTTFIFSTIAFAVASDLSIESDKQTFKMEENKAKFEGNVRVKMDDIKATSPRAEVLIDPNTKQLSEAIMYDKPYVVQVQQAKTNEIKANILKLSLLKKTVKGQGNTQTTVTENGALKPTVIITADEQQYDTNTKTLTAKGNVIIYYKDVETFSNTACGSNAVGGQIPTSGQVFIFLNYKREAIVIGPAWGYHISNFTDVFVKDLYNHHMAGTSNIRKIQEYGTISLITSFN